MDLTIDTDVLFLGVTYVYNMHMMNIETGYWLKMCFGLFGGGQVGGEGLGSVVVLVNNEIVPEYCGWPSYV